MSPTPTKCSPSGPASKRCTPVSADELADVYLALGRHAELIPQLEAAVVTDPLRERSYEQLMVALYRFGSADRRPSRVRQRAGDRLLDQVGVEPGRRLRELERAVLSHDDDVLAPTAPRPAATSGPEGSLRPFVGRDPEVERIVALASGQQTATTRHSCSSVASPGSARPASSTKWSATWRRRAG